MKQSDAAKVLKALIPTRKPIFLWGPPGIGKSQIVHQVVKQLDLDVLDLRAVLLDPVDLRGLPVPNGDRVHWKPPAFLPLKGETKGRKGVIFADELPQATQLVQSAFLQGIWDHRIGEIELDPDWTWIAAGNRQEDRAGAHRMITPMLNRFIHLDVEVSHEDWHEWAVQNEIAGEILGFLHFKPNLLHAFDPSKYERAFPTPRSWHILSTILPATSTDMILPVAMGVVGAAAAEFAAFCRTYRDLPDPKEVLKNPKTATVPTKPDICIALVTAIAQHCKTADSKTLDNAIVYGMRMQKEYCVLLFRDTALLNPKVLQVPSGKDFLYKNRDVLMPGAA